MAPKRSGHSSDPYEPFPKRLRGGPRQQLRWHHEAPEDASSSSVSSGGALAPLLMRKWSWGDFSAPTVQALAAAAVHDGCVDPLLRDLASIGSEGRFPGNCHADLLRKVPPTYVHRALTKFRVWLSPRPGRILVADHLLLLPHELFHIIYTHHREQFNLRLLGGSESNLRGFWTEMRDHPAYATHPVSARPDHLEKAIPIALHGDGVAISGVGKSWQKSVDAYSWTSLMSKGPTADVVFLIYIMNPKLAVKIPGRSFVTEFFQKLVWSLYWLFLGVWPARDSKGAPFPAGTADAERAGQPLAGGFFCTLWCLRGDLDHMSKVYGFPYWNQEEPCSLCRANRTVRPWTDARPTAAWIPTAWTSNAQWRAEVDNRHALFELPGAGVLLYYPDVMHTLHLGVYTYFLGSVLELLVARILPQSPESNMSTLWQAIRAEYQARNTECRFNDIRLGMFRPSSGKFPQLKGKAAEVRHLVAVMHTVFARYMDQTNRQHQQVNLCLELASRAENILDVCRDDWRLPEQAATEFRQCAFQFAQLQTSLAQFYHSRGEFLFHVTMKSHYFLHIAMSARAMNPRLGWCYSGEDLMAKVKGIVAASHFGANATMLSPKVLRKYGFGLGLALS